MRIFEPHAHMTSRTTDDYEAMAASGVKVLVEPAFWLGQPRTSAGSFVDYFNSLLGWERFRASQFGIRHHCTIGLNPKEANDDALRREVLDLLPRFLAKDGVVAVGEIGFDAMTPAEEEALLEQFVLAKEHELPALVHTPHRDKLAGTRRTLELVEQSGMAPETVLIDHNNELTVKEVHASGCWAGFSIYPNTKMDEYRMVRIVEDIGTDRILINSACDWGVSDPLKVAKTVAAMQEAGLLRGRHRQGRLAQPARVLRPERAADPRRPARGPRPGRDLRGQHAAARGALRLRHPDGSLLHLAYCSNVHPADDLDGIAAQLERFPARVREALGVDRLGVGMWVAAPALPGAERLRERLDALGLEVVTLNGFPYRAFHAEVVKLDVYRPNWATDARRDYTLGLARLLARAAARRRRRGLDLHAAARLAHGVVGRGRGGRPARAGGGRRRPRRAARRHGQDDPARAGARARLHDRDGRAGRGVPRRARARAGSGCASTPATSRCSSRTRRPRSRSSTRRARAWSRRRSPARCACPRRAATRAARSWRSSPSRASCTRRANALRGAVRGTDDLPEALGGRAARRGTSGACTSTCPSTPLEHTTQDELRATLRALAGGPAPRTRHYEVETYTWGVLPDGPGGDEGLVEGLAAELAWTRDRLVELGAEEVR